MSGRPTTLVWMRRRMSCDNCGERLLEDHHAFEIVDTFIAWSDEILAWHHTGRPSNGRIEGNKPTTCSKSCDAPLTASPTPPTSRPETC